MLSDWERRRAGCPDIHFHDLRHQAISRFFDMGLTTPEVASISGHRDIRISMQYSHPMRKRIIEQMDKGEVKRGSENEPPFATRRYYRRFGKKPLKPQAVVVPT